MKFRVAILALLLSLAAPLMAEERETRHLNPQPGFQKYGDSKPQKYTFGDYIADLKAAARKDEVQPGNPVSQSAKRPQEYKPLNPIVISW